MSGSITLGAPIGGHDPSSDAAGRATGPNPLLSSSNAETASSAGTTGHAACTDGSDKEVSRDDGHPGPSQKEVDAAVLIQRNYRGHAARKRVKRMHLDKDARWDELVKAQHEKSYADGQLDNKNDVRSRWQRGMQAATRLQDGEGLHSSTALPDGQTKADSSDDTENLTPELKKQRRATFWGSLTLGVGKEKDEQEELPFTSKSLEQQHWLEMIDGKHRYGSNLKYYFRKWKESDTEDNFFRWLDRGDGKDLDLEELPRERLEKEKITYLSAEQRLNYLVKVDKDGLLRWARNSELVDTAAGKWRDSGDCSGIVPEETWKELHPEEAEREAELYKIGGGSGSRSSSDLSVSSGWSAQSGLQENESTHYDEYNGDNRKGWLGRKVEGVTPAGVKKQLLRKTLKRNTWIYVSDMKLNMFIGIKQTGKFQHSSFLAGGKVTSAGIIVVKHGLVKSLNPWSGHYRSSIDAYRSFIGQLENKGVDLSHVKVGKSVMTMWGLTKAAKVRKGRGDFAARFRKALHLPHEPTEQEKSEEVQRNAEKQEEEHQRRMAEVQEAEDAQETDEDRVRVRREILYGRKRQPIQDADGTRHSPVQP